MDRQEKSKSACFLEKNKGGYRRFLEICQQLAASLEKLVAATGLSGENSGGYKTFVPNLRG